MKTIGKILFVASVFGCCFPATTVLFGVFGIFITLASVVYIGIYISK